MCVTYSYIVLGVFFNKDSLKAWVFSGINPILGGRNISSTHTV